MPDIVKPIQATLVNPVFRVEVAGLRRQVLFVVDFGTYEYVSGPFSGLAYEAAAVESAWRKQRQMFRLRAKT